MQLYLTRCALTNGTTCVVQEVVSTSEYEGAIAMAQRWLPELIDGCDGTVRLSTEFRAPFEPPGRNIHSFVDLPVYRTLGAVEWNVTDGAWPAAGQRGIQLHLLAADGSPLITVPVEDGSGALQLAHATLNDWIVDHDEEQAWARTTPQTVELVDAQGLVMRARLGLEFTYRVENPF